MPIIRTTKRLRPRSKNDLYPTPYELVQAALTAPFEWDARLGKPFLEKNAYRGRINVLDPGAGYGIWGIHFRRFFPEATLWGVEIDPRFTGWGYHLWFEDDFLTWTVRKMPQFDVVIGNPPYGYPTKDAAERIARKCWALLRPGGCMIFLLRLAFLESQHRCENFWPELPPLVVYTLGKRPSFTGDRKTDATAYAIYVWRKQEPSTVDPRKRWLMWDYND